MTGGKLCVTCLLLFGILTVSACSRWVSQEGSLPSWHPEALPAGRVDCSECHEAEIKGVKKPSATFKHSTEFIRQHRFRAEQDEKLCALCHRTSFCNDCHANELEMKPSVKLGNRPDRELMHRGDYVTVHMIDGKVDPTSCYRCHGRSNNERCVPCHAKGR